MSPYDKLLYSTAILNLKKKREKDAISGQKGIVFSLESFVRYVK